MRGINSLTVKYGGRVVGILVETKDGKCAFQYDREWRSYFQRNMGTDILL